MQKIEYILVEKLALLRKGIKAAFDEPGIFRMAEALTDVHKLAESIREHKPGLAVVNIKDLAVGELTEVLASVPLSDLPKVAILCENVSQPKSKQVKFVIPLQATEPELLLAVKEITDSFEELLPGDKEKGLTNREQAVLREIALGRTNKEIADILFISQHTAITHRKNITRKLGIKSVSGLTVFAILNKIISPNEVE